MRRSNLLFAIAKRLWKAIEADLSPRTPSSTVTSPCSLSSLVGLEVGTYTEVTGTLELCFEDGLVVDACFGVDPGGAFLVPVAEGGLFADAVVVVFACFTFCFAFNPLDVDLDVFDPGLVIFRVFQINSVAAVRRGGHHAAASILQSLPSSTSPPQHTTLTYQGTNTVGCRPGSLCGTVPFCCIARGSL
jgi:hypothetical protein